MFFDLQIVKISADLVTKMERGRDGGTSLNEGRLGTDGDGAVRLSGDDGER